MLDNKDLKFIECVANGLSRTDAYIEAYKTSSENRASISVMACKLWNKKEIQDEYLRLLKEQTKDMEFPKSIIIKKLRNQVQWLEENLTPTNASEYRRTLETLNTIANPVDLNDTTEDNLRQLIQKVDISMDIKHD